MTLHGDFTASLRAALDAAPSRSPPLQPLQPLADTDSALVQPPARPPPLRMGPPRLVLGTQTDEPAEDSTVRPALTIQPASPAPSSPAAFTSPTAPFPPPIPSTSSSADTPSFQPPSPRALGGGLAARRAAKLGKKRLSLVVPANPHSSVPAALLSPASPSYLRPGGDLDAETRSLPPSPVSLTTFIGTEGAEAPDRTIGRLMLKQQADEMREQMKGGRGMKRRTSIPRLNLVGGTNGAAAKPANLDSLAAGANAAPAPGSVVQMLRRDGVERAGPDAGEEGGEVEEFPYALGPREILPGVFLGSEQNARDPKVLREWKIGFVLNVAKEVDCPWTDEMVEEMDEAPSAEASPPTRSQEATPVVASSSPSRQRGPSESPSSRHRRTKTQAAVPAAAAPAPDTAKPVRPLFIRPTASTPNLHDMYNPLSPPPVPSIPAAYLPTPPASDSHDPLLMQRSLSSSPPVPRRTPPRPLRRAAPPPTSTRSSGAVRLPRNRRTGRPALEYLWLKWGHDEADLVEARKFQAAFDFLDEARERGERVLVHCQCGVSRSATVVIAYCMREAAKALEEGRDASELAGCTGMHDTYSFVKEKSEWVGPNLSLVFQLVAYERTLRGDALEGEDGEELHYPHYPPEPPSPPATLPNGLAPRTNGLTPTPAFDDDLPPSMPADSFSGFNSPPPLPRISVPSRDAVVRLPPPLPSPHTPISDVSMADSQLSTPDLHDPLISPTFSTGTKASSVNSTPLSIASSLRDALPEPSVRIVGHDDDARVSDFGAGGMRDRHSSLDTVVGYGESTDEQARNGKPFFVLPLPPTRPHVSTTFPPEAISPTVATHPPHSRAAPPSSLPTLSISVPPSPLTIVTSPPALSPVNGTAAPPSASTAADSALSPAASLVSSTSTVSIASTLSALSSTSTSTLSRSNSSARRFGAGQSASQRRASHKRVFSDTIKVEKGGLGMTSASASSNAAAGTPGGSAKDECQPS
ncbi:hypothetical protein JCM10207_003944 [Rhodosporidiobolus poonsookiae]